MIPTAEKSVQQKKNCSSFGGSYLAVVYGVFKERVEEKVGEIWVSSVSFFDVVEKAATKIALFRIIQLKLTIVYQKDSK